MGLKYLAAALFFASIARPQAPPLTAEAIMGRVAENQDRIVKERTRFVYDESIHVTTRHPNGKLICEQTTNYTVTPKEKSTQHTLVSTHGQYVRKGKWRQFDKDPSEDETIDTGLVKSFRDDLTQTDSKDGIGKDLFPLTTDEQKDLEFKLTGERIIANRPAYVIEFRPRDHHELGWAGEAVIDKEDFQPVTVYTKLSRRLPFLVHTMLGTDLPGVGFTTQYTRVADGIWFPASFGSEFKIHAVFFFNRAVTIGMENKNFRRANVDAEIHYDSPSN